jgi:hypothetical protein
MGPYLGGYIGHALGSQVDQKIYDKLDQGSQVDQKITDSLEIGSQVDQQTHKLELSGQQINQMIDRTDDSKIQGSQVDQFVAPLAGIGSQVSQTIYELLSIGSQVDMTKLTSKLTPSQVDQIIGKMNATGMNVRIYPLMHLMWQRYLTNPYLTDSYLAAGFHTLQSSQVEQKLYHPHKLGTQVFQNVYEVGGNGQQIDLKVTSDLNIGNQVNQKLVKFADTGSQVDQLINDVFSIGNQVELKIYDDNKVGSQATLIKISRASQQVQMVIYNITQLRILQNFVSRGTETLGGLNWTSNYALRLGDYAASNLNTDVIEQRCETWGIPATWILTCDTGIPQGAFVDTLGILGHNLTKSARVTFQGSSDPLFGTVDFSVVLISELINTYWISPALPNAGYRYWRLIIEDLTNLDDNLYIGAIVFGSSAIMSVSETFENPIQYGLTHYKDSVETEGYRNVSNDRALRKKLSLSFSNLRYDSGNYAMLKDYWLEAKTDIACLIIPRPSKPSAFAVFSKLTQLAQEEHNAISDYDHYVSFSLDWDEAL